MKDFLGNELQPGNLAIEPFNGIVIFYHIHKITAKRLGVRTIRTDNLAIGHTTTVTPNKVVKVDKETFKQAYFNYKIQNYGQRVFEDEKERYETMLDRFFEKTNIIE
jgi:hypothetical protein